MMDLQTASHDYNKIERAIQYLEENFTEHPSLKEIAHAACLSEYHFQRVFSRWVGISPKRFLQFLTKEYARELLKESHSLLDTAYETGLTGPGRLHDLFISCEAVTPGEFKSGGEGIHIEYGIHPSPFGDYLLARTDRGICNLFFLMDGDREHAVNELRRDWPRARLEETQPSPAAEIELLFASAAETISRPLHLHLKGTNFQIKVWEALIKVPSGRVVTYQDVARMIGRPDAVRAVAGAVARNPVSFIIPCHRVIRKMGVFHNYRWGSARKKLILGWEAAALHPEQAAAAG